MNEFKNNKEGKIDELKVRTERMNPHAMTDVLGCFRRMCTRRSRSSRSTPCQLRPSRKTCKLQTLNSVCHSISLAISILMKVETI